MATRGKTENIWLRDEYRIKKERTKLRQSVKLFELKFCISNWTNLIFYTYVL